MNIKDEIENLLSSLKKRGIDRRSIEEDMDYSEGYIDQLVSKGGNKKFLSRLKKYNIAKSKKNISPTNLEVNEEQAPYGQTIKELLTLLRVEQDNVKEAHGIIRILAEKVPKAPPDIGISHELNAKEA